MWGVFTDPKFIQFLFMIGVLGALASYILLLRRYRQKPKDQEITKAPENQMSVTELERYARHIVLREVGGAGQQKLKAARVLIVGAGGLGCPVLQYLAAAGVGTIGVIDEDIVSLSNLQRQVLYDESQLNMPKVFAVQKKLNAFNPHIKVLPYNRYLTEKIATDLIAEYDLVLDGTDTFETRALVNQACVKTRVPLISGAISRWEGQITLFDPANGTPCYACIFPEKPTASLVPSCAEAGVMGALPGIIGSIMAADAIKHITGAGPTLAGEMLIFDALYGESRKVKVQRNSACQICQVRTGKI